jgi:hypothetical protein
MKPEFLQEHAEVAEKQILPRSLSATSAASWLKTDE